MITKVMVQGFKGISFETPLKQYNLFVGPNGAGKSARTEALAIAVMGYNPRDQKKRPGDIVATHGTGDEFVVGFEIENDGIKQVFSRRFKKTESGGVMECYCNKQKQQAKQIEATLYKIGNPRVFDLAAFNALSDAGKIGRLFELFPPAIDVADLEEKIQGVADKESQLAGDLKAIKATTARLTKERSEIDVSGTVAEIQADIAAKEKALEEAQGQLKEIEAEARQKSLFEEAKRKQDAQAKAEAEEAARKAQEAQKLAIQEAVAKDRAEQVAMVDAEIKKERAEKAEKIIEVAKEINSPVAALEPSKTVGCDCSDLLDGLEKVRTAMERAQCSTCAGMIVLKSLMRKYQAWRAA